MSVRLSAQSENLGRSLATVQYRYPGSPPFRDSETDRRLFLGRDSEVDVVLHSILSFDLFLLYAESGLGKTSLLNAGVASRLRERGLWPVSVRLNDPGRTPVEQICEQIVAAAASDPDVELVDAARLIDGDESDSSLWNALSALEVWRGNELQKLVVILDQFEEIFTLGWEAERQQQFFAEFGEVVRRHRDGSAWSSVPAPDVKFVIVIREDALGELEALSTDVPQIMRHRVRLGPLGPEQAAIAIREPATIDDSSIDSVPFEFSDEAVEEIIEFLRTQNVRGSTVRSAAVDPSQLQIIYH